LAQVVSTAVTADQQATVAAQAVTAVMPGMAAATELVEPQDTREEPLAVVVAEVAAAHSDLVAAPVATVSWLLHF
jgi:hypothetical protein